MIHDQATGILGTMNAGTESVVAKVNLGIFTPQTSYPFWMGHRPGDVPGNATYGAYLGGLLDELSVYRRALGSNEIAALYNAGTSGKCSGVLMSNELGSVNYVATDKSDCVGGRQCNILGDSDWFSDLALSMVRTGQQPDPGSY